MKSYQQRHRIKPIFWLILYSALNLDSVEYFPFFFSHNRDGKQPLGSFVIIIIIIIGGEYFFYYGLRSILLMVIKRGVAMKIMMPRRGNKIKIGWVKNNDPQSDLMEC